MPSWKEMSCEERDEEFWRLKLPDEVQNTRQIGALEVKLSFFHFQSTLEKLKEGDYVHFNIDLFHSDLVVMSAKTLLDVESDESNIDNT